MLKTIANHLIPVQVIKLCVILNDAGYQAFLVGGCIRDMLLGDKPKDYDIATDASPEKIMTIFPKHIATGLKHGTITVCLDKENHFEVTTFRVEGIYLDGRRPEEVKFVKKVEEDLARRDFTINAIAYDPINNILIDPFGGLQDIQYRIIKAVGDPNARFQEDGLRIMRAARFAARFGYQVDHATLEGMRANLEILKLVSRERVKDELWKTLATDKPSVGLHLLRKCGVLFQIEKELERNLASNIVEIDYIPQAEIETKFAVFCANFATHTLEKISKELKLANNEFKKIKFLLDSLDKFAIYLRNQTAYEARVFLAHIKNNSPDTNSLREFLYFSDAIGLEARQDLDKYQAEIVWARSELQINGDDLMAEGVKPGPNMKILLDSCYSEVLEHPEHNNKEYLLQFCLAIL